jgi:hypothetical protein
MNADERRLLVRMLTQAAEKLIEIAPCGRGSESALRKIDRLPSRDHRERSSGAAFSGHGLVR